MEDAIIVWECRSCGSADVELAFPAWYRQDPDSGEIDHTDTDFCAEPLYWACNDCGEGGGGVPARRPDYRRIARAESGWAE